MSFTHLHVHTQHSFLDGVPTLPDLVSRVKELGQGAVAITDHGEVSGHLKFQKAAQEGGITPIFGMEGYFVDDISNKVRYDYQHITLLAVSQVGLTNLWKLSSRAYTEGMYYKPRIDWNMLQEYSEGIIATGGCLGGCVANYLIEGEDQYNPGLADERIGRFMDILEDRFYLEIHTFPDDRQRNVNKKLVEKAGTFGVPLIAVSDSHYLRPEGWEDHELLIAAQMQKKWNDPTRYTYGPGALHVMSEDEVFEKLSGHLPKDIVRRAMDNTVDISDRVAAEKVEVQGQRTFPIFLNKIDDDIEKLKTDAWSYFEDRIGRFNFEEDKLQIYRDRLIRELDLVISKGYAGYFLITADVIRWAKDKGILVGPGRGSAGGSLLSYVLRITEVDPIKFDLLFERFLDPQLKSLPDIDMDVPQIERHEVLEYLRERYEVAGIGTLNTLKPRVLLNDFCRVLNIPHDDNRLMTEIIANTKDLIKDDLDWPSVYQRNTKEFEKWEDEYSRLFELMHSFSAHYRHAGAHAAAVVVNREPLLGKLPLRVKDEEIRTQMPMEDVEELGFMKMDFLGLRTLSTLMRALEMAQANWTPESGKPEPKHYYEWQYEWEKYYEDEDVYKSLWDGRNLGIFQVETDGISSVAKRYLPQSVEDLCAVISLFRPGITRAIDPESKLNLMELMLQKREGRYPISFRHESLEPILQNTYGAFLYQEQIMRTVRDLGDFDPELQSKVRKILGKKKASEMKNLKETFVKNAAPISPEIIEIIWNDMETFGEYGFNKSHGLAYGMIAYWTAWMKHHYTKEFMTALFQTNEGEIKAYNRECRRLEIPLLAPDINESDADFALVNGRIRYGFLGIKGIGESSSQAVQQNRPYTSVSDVVAKLEGTSANKKTIESMIRVGALDSVVSAEDREGLPEGWSITKVALYRLFRGKLKIGPRKDAGLDESGIFQKYLPEFKEYANDLDIDDRDVNEPLFLGEHVETLPFGKWLEPIKEYYAYPGYSTMWTGEKALLGGTIGEIKEFKVKKKGPNEGRLMAQIWLEYPVIEDGKVIDIENTKLVCFPKEYTYVRMAVDPEAPVLVKVEKLQDRDGFEGGLCIQSIYRIDRGEHPSDHMQSRSLNDDRELVAVSATDDPTQAEGFFD